MVLRVGMMIAIILYLGNHSDSFQFDYSIPPMVGLKQKMDLNVILIDNYDSFTYNIYQYLCQLGAKTTVYRNDSTTLSELDELKPTHLVISPGPGNPKTAGISCAAIKHFAGRIPILGVCLGHQCMWEVYGGVVGKAGEIVHGKTSLLSHDSLGVYTGLHGGFAVTRYHSLAGLGTVPEELVVSATCVSVDGESIVMGVRHKKYVMEGVQYHPESVASVNGKRLFANFLSWRGGKWNELETREIQVPDVCKTMNVVGAGVDVAQLSLDAHSSEKSILERIRTERIKQTSKDRAVPGRSFRHLQRLSALISTPVKRNIKKDSLAVFAEIKRASPSAGRIAGSACAASTALEYAAAGAAWVSVLTEPNFFHGSLNDLYCVSQVLRNTNVIVLRKDFIVDEYMILEARVAGADAVLLIVSLLKNDLLKLITFTHSLGMHALVEVVDESECKHALRCGARIIGINKFCLY